MFAIVCAPVLAYRTWATNVVPRRSRAAAANWASSQAAMGCLLTSGWPAGPNVPTPAPSGLRWLCARRLSGASISQNVAATSRGPACSPNKRHMALAYRKAAPGNKELTCPP